jgi:hypothetical protein
MRRWRSKKSTHAHHRERNRPADAARKRELYAARRAAGLCACGATRDVPGRASCSTCLARLRARRATAA